MPDRVVLLSIPQLRHRDVSPGALASLDELTGHGAEAELMPAFPGLAGTAFATLVTGKDPSEHGLIGNTYFDRAERRVAPFPLPDSAVQAPKLWDHLRTFRPEARSMLWFLPNSRGAVVDFDAWVDSSWTLGTQPDGLADRLVSRFGPFPSSSGKPGEEPPRLEATAWILKTASATIAEELPDLALVRVPYLGKVARRYGPDGREANRAVRELEGVLAPFLQSLPKGTAVVVVTESVVTPVTNVVFPNRALRDLGLLAVRPCPSGGTDIDLQASAAFALADHQLCHIYLNDPGQAAPVASSFSSGAFGEGVLGVVASPTQRIALGLDHSRSGDVVLVACPDSWFAPDWWTDPSEAPGGLDDASSGLAHATPNGLLNPDHVKGSLGSPPPNEEYLGLLITSHPEALPKDSPLALRDIAAIVLDLLGRPKGTPGPVIPSTAAD
ncbi:alkaline phosphatase family protein [soil metagenome]